jgi:hypothetical protein
VTRTSASLVVIGDSLRLISGLVLGRMPRRRFPGLDDLQQRRPRQQRALRADRRRHPDRLRQHLTAVLPSPDRHALVVYDLAEVVRVDILRPDRDHTTADSHTAATDKGSTCMRTVVGTSVRIRQSRLPAARRPATGGTALNRASLEVAGVQPIWRHLQRPDIAEARIEHARFDARVLILEFEVAGDDRW